MSLTIKIHRTENSKLSSVDFNNIPFGQVFSDHMFEADYKDGSWGNFNIRPLENLSIHPGNLAWHYGQSIFEGMKATAKADGTPLLFRPEQHIIRLNRSAERMCMPSFPDDVFLDAIEQLVQLEKEWIPKKKGSALYIRPVMFAMDEALGVRPSDSYKLLIFTLPVGPYYPKPVSLLAEDTYVRAAEGGVGFAKTSGNYAASLYPAKLAKEKGYDQVMWMDSKEFKYVQEVGTMNIMFVIDNEIYTPATGDTILKGITRDSVLQILQSEGYKVHEGPVNIDDIISAHKDGRLTEVFGTGTAAVIANVSKFAYKGTDYHLNPEAYKVSPFIKSYIDDLRAGEREDPFQWIQELNEDVLV